jgi:hypothetical protein
MCVRTRATGISTDTLLSPMESSRSGFPMRFIARLRRAIGVKDRTDQNDATPEQSDTPKPSLYQCPSCETVFVAVDKQTCSTCETDVERVPTAVTEI